MKKLVVFFAALFIMVIAVQNVNAQSSATAASSANVLQALAILNDAPLNFGDISATATAGTVSIDNTGARSRTGGAAPVGADGEFAQFTITGPANETIAITLNQTSFNVTNTGGSGETMEVTLNASDVTTATGTTSTGGTGEVILKFGGTVNVAANQAIGLYENDAAFEVTVDYN